MSTGLGRRGVHSTVEGVAFRTVNGETAQVKAIFGAEDPAAPAFLEARSIRLTDGPELRLLTVAGSALRVGYDRLDNEILAGLRLWETTQAFGYPPEASRLYGYEASSCDPYVLLEPYRGDPLTVTGQHLLEHEQHQFQVSLLTGLCWLAAAGIAHRGIAPSTVRWDGRRAQITDFSLSTLIGAPREAIGTLPWAAREQRPGHARAQVSAQDDIWAAGRLIFYIETGEELADRGQLDERPALRNLLTGVFGPPEDRPSARELLRRLDEECPVPRALGGHSPLDAGRERFYVVRARKHPGMVAAVASDAAGPGGSSQAERAPAEQGIAQADVLTAGSHEMVGPLKGARRLLRAGHYRRLSGQRGVLNQIVYQAPSGVGGTIQSAAASMRELAEADRWLIRLDPWLRTGTPGSRGYLALGSQAVFIRWQDDGIAGRAWQYAHVLIGQANALSVDHALQMPSLSAEALRLPVDGRLPQIVGTDLGGGSAAGAIESRARSQDVIELLVPLLSRILAGERCVMMPWTAPLLPEAVIWSLSNILSMLGDRRPISFLTCASASATPPDGLFLMFLEGAALPRPDPGFESQAIGLATGYADGPEELRLALVRHGILEPADQPSRNARLFELWPSSGPSAQDRAAADNPGHRVICPICLSEIDDWERLPRWRWDAGQGTYMPLEVPADVSRQHRTRMERGASVRCPGSHHVSQGEHYLPVDYGRFGTPVVLGFVGVTMAGKSHLLTTMVGEIERGGLQDYGIQIRPIDPALHQAFLDERVRPLMVEDKVLPGTQEGLVSFADAFLIRSTRGAERPVALFDVAGGDLARVQETKQFLEIADGLIFVVDPDRLNADGLGDVTFNNVLDLVRSAGESPDRPSAAIVLSKADLVRFEDPVALWLRSDNKVLDSAEFERESADVYAYLSERGATAWARPYSECARATLHVASSTGGSSDQGSYPRGVTPRRVLRPLVAMLAMTGVLTSTEAQRIGI
jgi:serine/threonine protein kinase